MTGVECRPAGGGSRQGPVGRADRRPGVSGLGRRAVGGREIGGFGPLPESVLKRNVDTHVVTAEFCRLVVGVVGGIRFSV